MKNPTLLRRVLGLLAVVTLGFGAAACGDAETDGSGGGTFGGEGGAEVDDGGTDLAPELEGEGEMEYEGE